MSATYTGDCEWAEAKPPTYSKDAWGFDQITRTFNGRSDKLETFVETYKHDYTLRDTTHRYCTFTNLNVSPGEIFSEVQVAYRGIVGNELPAISVVGGRRLQSVSVEYTGSTLGQSTGITLEVEYYAPYKTVTWYTFGTLRTLNARDESSINRAVLAGQQYEDMLKDLVITNMVGAKAELNILRSKRLARGQYIAFPTFGDLGAGGVFDNRTLTYNVVAQLIESSYTYEQVGAEIIKEQSTIELRLIEARMGSTRPTLQLS